MKEKFNIEGNLTGIGHISGGNVTQIINPDNQIEVTIELFKSHYQTNFETISLLINDNIKPIEDIFVNLAIIKEKKEETKKDKLINRETFLSSYEEIHKPKEPIAIEKLIDKSKKSLIYGKAGIGKTTLCKYISYKWAKGELYQEFDYVIYIPLREWRDGGVKGAIKDYYYSRDTKDISIDIESNKVLFLFDGYDELDAEKKKILRDEISKNYLSHYIITSRPYGYVLNEFKVDEQFETIGFTDENVDSYIEKYFSNQAEQQSLKNFLKTNINIKHIAYIPLMLEMICTLWEDKSKNSQTLNSPMTMTELYSDVVEYILNRYSAKKDDKRVYKRKNRQKIEDYLGKIAFEGLKRQKILFDGDFIEEIMDDTDFFEENIIYSGFLKSDNREKDLLDNSFEFPHLTFQEYFSALYVSKLPKEEISKIVRDYKFYLYMQVFFAFLGGLIEDKEFLLREIESEPRDLVGFYEFLLILILISNFREIELKKEKIESFNKNLIKWLKFTLNEKKNHILILEKLQLVRYFISIEVLKDLVDFMIEIEDKNTFLERKKVIKLLFSNMSINNRVIGLLIEKIKDKQISKNRQKYLIIFLLDIIPYNQINIVIELIKENILSISSRKIIFDFLRLSNIKNNKIVEELLSFIGNKDYFIEDRVEFSKILISVKHYDDKYINGIRNLMENNDIELQILKILSPLYSVIYGLESYEKLIKMNISILEKIEIGKRISNIKNDKRFINYLLSSIEKNIFFIREKVHILLALEFIGNNIRFIKILLIFLKNEEINFYDRLNIAEVLFSIDKKNKNFFTILIIWLKQEEEKNNIEFVLELIKIVYKIDCNNKYIFNLIINLLNDEKVDYLEKIELSKQLYKIDSKKFSDFFIFFLKNNEIFSLKLNGDLFRVLAKLREDNESEIKREKIEIHSILDILNEKNIRMMENIIQDSIDENVLLIELLDFIKFRENKNEFIISFKKLKNINKIAFINIFFKKNNEIKNTIKNAFYSILPLYLKNNKLCTIYKNQEIQTQREVSLEEIERVKRELGLP